MTFMGQKEVVDYKMVKEVTHEPYCDVCGAETHVRTMAVDRLKPRDICGRCIGLGDFKAYEDMKIAKRDTTLKAKDIANKINFGVFMAGGTIGLLWMPLVLILVSFIIDDVNMFVIGSIGIILNMVFLLISKS